MKKYTKTLKEAKELFKQKTGENYDLNNPHHSIKIFRLKIKKTSQRKYFVGTVIEWLNL